VINKNGVDMDKPKTISFSRRKLPHWQVANRPYFITFRLKGSLPHSVVEDLKSQKEKLQNQTADSEQLYQYHRSAFKRIESVLDNVNNNDNFFLTKPNIASLIMNAFEFIEQKYCWRFPAFVIMPNHVHCLAVVTDNGIKKTLPASIGYLKSFVAKESNKILGRSGKMWADENFDHWCRTPGKVEGVIRYIRNNPVKAQLVERPEDWQWVK
jgi:REP element-mobilizing transposase RayT